MNMISCVLFTLRAILLERTQREVASNGLGMLRQVHVWVEIVPEKERSRPTRCPGTARV